MHEVGMSDGRTITSNRGGGEGAWYRRRCVTFIVRASYKRLPQNASLAEPPILKSGSAVQVVFISRIKPNLESIATLN